MQINKRQKVVIKNLKGRGLPCRALEDRYYYIFGA